MLCPCKINSDSEPRLPRSRTQTGRIPCEAPPRLRRKPFRNRLPLVARVLIFHSTGSGILTPQEPLRIPKPAHSVPVSRRRASWVNVRHAHRRHRPSALERTLIHRAIQLPQRDLMILRRKTLSRPSAVGYHPEKGRPPSVPANTVALVHDEELVRHQAAGQVALSHVIPWGSQQVCRLREPITVHRPRTSALQRFVVPPLLAMSVAHAPVRRREFLASESPLRFLISGIPRPDVASICIDGRRDLIIGCHRRGTKHGSRQSSPTATKDGPGANPRPWSGTQPLTVHKVRGESHLLSI